MNTHRKLTTLFLALILTAASAASADVYKTPQRIREVPDYPHHPYDVDVEIWTNRGDGSRYCAGDSIEVFFRTNVDAWVAIYNVDTRGRIHKLYPSRHAANNFVRGGVVHRLPSRYGYHFEVEGPSGWETLRAVASTDRRALRHYGRTHRGVNGYGNRYGDRYDNYHHHEGDCDSDHYDHRPTRYLPASSNRIIGVPDAIREVPDYPHHDPEIAVAETWHYVRDGYRCRVPRPYRPWWHRR